MPSELEMLDFSAFDPQERVREIANATSQGHTIRCGWVPPPDRTQDQQKNHIQIVRGMPDFHIRRSGLSPRGGTWQANSRQYLLYEARRTVFGSDINYINQITGSCVGCGGAQAAMTGMCVEIAIKGDPERPEMLWWPFTYGKSRQRAGMRGRGEGSFGSAWVQAITLDGIFEAQPQGQPDLPDFQKRSNWMVLTQSVELEWSDGAAIRSNWVDLGKQHRFRSAAPCKSVGDVTAALANGFAITIAGMIGTRTMAPAPQSDPPVRIARYAPVWAHQQSILAVYDHPKLGLIFWVCNQWGPDAHGTPTIGEPPGGYWYLETDLAQLLKARDTECYALSMFDGFPAREPLINFSAF